VWLVVTATVQVSRVSSGWT